MQLRDFFRKKTPDHVDRHPVASTVTATPTNGLNAVINGVLAALNDAQQMSTDAVIGALATSIQQAPQPRRNAVIERVDLTLTFALNRPSASGQIGSDIVIHLSALQAATETAAVIALTQLSARLAASKGGPPESADDAEIIGNLTAPPIAGWLAGLMAVELRHQAADLLDDAGTLDRTKTGQLLESVATRHLTTHADLAPLLIARAIGAPTFDLSKAAGLLEGVITRRDTVTPLIALEIVVDAAELAKLPASALQTMTLSLGMRDLDSRSSGNVIIQED